MRWLAATYAANHWATRWNYVVVDDASGVQAKAEIGVDDLLTQGPFVQVEVVSPLEQSERRRTAQPPINSSRSTRLGLAGTAP